MSLTEIALAILGAIAAIEFVAVFVLGRAALQLRSVHEQIDSAHASLLSAHASLLSPTDSPTSSRWVPYPAAWRVQEKSGPLMLCEPHLEQHDQERGASFIPLEPARAGSQCAACLREAAIFKARAA